MVAGHLPHTSCQSGSPRSSPPLRPHAWAAALASHPDEAFRDYICRGISQGFRVGFDHRVVCESAGRNTPPTQAHQEPVEEFLQQECEARRIVGPMPKSHLRAVQVNRIGVIPKSTPGKWRIIVSSCLSFAKKWCRVRGRLLDKRNRRALFTHAGHHDRRPNRLQVSHSWSPINLCNLPSLKQHCLWLHVITIVR